MFSIFVCIFVKPQRRIWLKQLNLCSSVDINLLIYQYILRYLWDFLQQPSRDFELHRSKTTFFSYFLIKRKGKCGNFYIQCPKMVKKSCICDSRNIENVCETKTQRFESEKSAVCGLGEPLLNSDKIIKLHRAAQISVRGCLVWKKLILFHISWEFLKVQHIIEVFRFQEN